MRRLLLALLLIATACGGEASPPRPSPPMVTLATGDWERLPAMPTPRSQLAAALLGDEVYTAGGLTKPPGGRFVASAAVEVFDTATGAWRSVADLPEPRHHLMAATLGGWFYVFGGLVGTDRPTSTAWRYDPATDEWADIADLPRAVGSGGAVVSGDFIYVVGGVDRGTSVYRYDPARDRWETVAPMAEPSEHLAVVGLDDRIYAVAGRWLDDELAKVEVYDAAADEWGTAPPVREPRGGFDAVAWDGRIVVVGGEVVGTRDTLASIEVFDPAGDEWALSEPLPIELEGHRVFVVGGVLYVVGGLPLPANAEHFGGVWRRTLVAP